MRLPDARPRRLAGDHQEGALPPRQRQEGPPPPLQVDPEAGQKECRADGLKHERTAARSQRAKTMEVDPQQGPAFPPKTAKKEAPMHYKGKIKVYPDESDNATEFLPEDLEYLNDCCETVARGQRRRDATGKDPRLHDPPRRGVHPMRKLRHRLKAGAAAKRPLQQRAHVHRLHRAGRKARAPSGGCRQRAVSWATTSSGMQRTTK